jgi:hypothetical protein
MFWTKRTGHLSDEDLSVFIDGELTGARLDAAQRHVAACPDCSAAVAELRDLKTLVARLPLVEPSRSFVLTPSMAGAGQKRPQAAPPRRPSLAFVPAVALTLLVALFAVDLSMSSSNSSSDESATASQAIAKDASPNAVADSAGGAGEGQERSTFAAPSAPNPAAAVAPTPQRQQQPPSTGSVPPSPPSVAGPSTNQAESATGGGQPVPVPSPNPAAATAPQPSSPGTLSSEAAPVGNTAADTVDKTGDDGASPSREGAAAQRSDEGTDWLRIAEAIAAVALIVSALFVFGPGLIKKGH